VALLNQCAQSENKNVWEMQTWLAVLDKMLTPEQTCLEINQQNTTIAFTMQTLNYAVARMAKNGYELNENANQEGRRFYYELIPLN